MHFVSESAINLINIHFLGHKFFLIHIIRVYIVYSYFCFHLFSLLLCLLLSQYIDSDVKTKDTELVSENIFNFESYSCVSCLLLIDAVKRRKPWTYNFLNILFKNFEDTKTICTSLKFPSALSTTKQNKTRKNTKNTVKMFF